MTSGFGGSHSFNRENFPGPEFLPDDPGAEKPVLGDRYQPIQLLGKKAGRQTWRAIDLQTQTPVVVKLLTFSPDFHWDDLKLFEREAETLRSLSHPAIPRYLDSFECDLAQGKGFAIVQSYIDAPSLQQHLKAGRSFTEAEVKHLAKDLLGILDFLHTRQPPVIHRDLKPSNILLGDRSGNSPGQVYLVDFGSVQTLVAREGGTITVVGTYGYMPPEQFGGRAFPASDLYSLGTTLIYLVTGQHPADLPQADLRLDFSHIANLSPSFTHWLQSMTEPSLNKRLATAAAALEQLETPENPVPSSLKAPRPQPKTSKIEVQRTAHSLKLLLASHRVAVPGRPMSCGSLVLLGIATLCVFPLLGYSLWAIFAVPIFLLSTLFGRTRLEIHLNQISIQRELWRWRLNRLVDAPKRHVWKLTVPPDASRRLVLWIGEKKCDISVSSLDELEWLAQELSVCLDLPISREYF